MKRIAIPAALALLIAVSTNALAALGSVVTSFSPSPVGNGRAVAFDPSTGHLFFTNASDPHIYVITTTNTPVATLSTGVNYGALSWDSKRGVLWGGRYDGTGGVDQISPTSGAVTTQFTFVFPAGDSCYGQQTGFTDGLAYDATDDSLWLSDDNARTLFHTDLRGSVLGRSTVPNNRCNTGIASAGPYLWLGLQSGPDQAPFDIVRVAKSNPTAIISTFGFGTTAGPEGIAFDAKTFTPTKCVLWSNQFNSTTLTAWELEQNIDSGCTSKFTATFQPPYDNCTTSASHSASPAQGSTQVLAQGFSSAVASCDSSAGTVRYRIVTFGGTAGSFNLFSKSNPPSQQAQAQSGVVLNFTPTFSGQARIDVAVTVSGKASAAAGSGLAASITLQDEIGSTLLDLLAGKEVSPLLDILKASLQPTAAITNSNVFLQVSGGATGFANGKLLDAGAAFPVPGPYSQDVLYANKQIVLSTVVGMTTGQPVQVSVGAGSTAKAWGTAEAFVNLMEANSSTQVNSITVTQQ